MDQAPGAPPGFLLQNDFITPDHQTSLLHIFRNELLWPIRSSEDDGQPVKHKPLSSTSNLPLSRLSLHYGHHFCYKTFGIDTTVPHFPFPPWLRKVLPPFCPSSTHPDQPAVPPGRDPDQVCLQYYPPGAGIPPHVDTHSAFESLFGLSLGSGVVMEFRKRSQKPESDAEEEAWVWERRDIFVPPRSLYDMSGDSQYHWQHGIKKRKNDLVPNLEPGQAGETLRLPRADRFSITFRWVRSPAVCECGDEWLCDTAMARNGVERVLRWKEASKDAIDVA